jgi:putative transposase
MAQSLAKVLLHIVFSTKERRPYLRERAMRDEAHSYLGGIVNQSGCQSLVIGGVEDHVHLLCALSRTCTIADLVKELKRGSTLWIRERWPRLNEFSWQSGYGAFSIGASQIEDVRRYIGEQEVHHARVSFQDEFRLLLGRYGIEFDERYVWD